MLCQSHTAETWQSNNSGSFLVPESELWTLARHGILHLPGFPSLAGGLVGALPMSRLCCSSDEIMTRMNFKENSLSRADPFKTLAPDFT
jgi:hypothetical protein